MAKNEKLLAVLFQPVAVFGNGSITGFQVIRVDLSRLGREVMRMRGVERVVQPGRRCDTVSSIPQSVTRLPPLVVFLCWAEKPVSLTCRWSDERRLPERNSSWFEPVDDRAAGAVFAELLHADSVLAECSPVGLVEDFAWPAAGAGVTVWV
jgi:hypothetical protein